MIMLRALLWSHLRWGHVAAGCSTLPVMQVQPFSSWTLANFAFHTYGGGMPRTDIAYVTFQEQVCDTWLCCVCQASLAAASN